MRVLGLAFTGHGTSACLVEDGRIACAVNLERITRRKFTQVTLPSYRPLIQRIHESFNTAEAPELLDFFEVFPRLLEYVAGAPTISEAGIDLVVKVPDHIQQFGPKPRGEYLRFLETFEGARTHFDLEHHLCHAYQAYLCSPFESAAVLTLDGLGEKLDRLGGESVTASLAIGEARRIRVLAEVVTPFSIGGMYETFTKHLGFRNEQEGNTMALAAFGEPEFAELAREVPILMPDGSFLMKLNEAVDNQLWNELMLAYCPRRQPGGPLEQKHENLAFGVQQITETLVLNAARGIHERTGKKQLAIAGGVGLNCVANGKILSETPIEALYVMPNSGDRGLAAGAALYGYHVLLDRDDRTPPEHDYFGREYSDADVEKAIAASSDVESARSPDIAGDVAALIAEGHIVGWHQGGCEFGPRALGHRSILADPRTPHSKERLDREIKRREWFRPYAPSVLADCADDYFEMHGPSPYMLQAVQTRPERTREVPGIVHVDGSARVQTVDPAVEPRYHRLISAFREKTGVPLVLNTSFNGYGEPMVETPENAIDAMKSMGFDALGIGDHLVWPAGRRPGGSSA